LTEGCNFHVLQNEFFGKNAIWNLLFGGIVRPYLIYFCNESAISNIFEIPGDIDFLNGQSV
jgi:hypothetical protein